MKHIESFGNYQLISEQVIQRPGDPYEYKVDGDNWLARKKGTEKWVNISGDGYKDKFQKSIDKLDKENPTARTPNAPKRNKSEGNTPKKSEEEGNEKESKPKSDSESKNGGDNNKEKKPTTQKELLEKIRLTIKKSIDTMPKNVMKKTWDKACKKIDDISLSRKVHSYEYGYEWYNMSGKFWPITLDNHPSSSYEKFSNLFLNFWSKGTCPKNWNKNYEKFIKSHDDWATLLREHIPNIEAYGKAESEWLNLYAQYSDIIPVGTNLYEYYKSLGTSEQKLNGEIPKDWQPRSGVIFLPVKGRGDISRGSRLKRGTESENFPWRGLPSELINKKDVKSVNNFLILPPSNNLDFEDMIEFVEDGSLDFIRNHTMIIIPWSSKYKISVINQDIEDVKKYLGITTTVSSLSKSQMDKVNKIISEEI